MENVNDFARAGPEEFGFGLALEQRYAGAHEGHWVHAGVGDAAGEDGDDGRDGGIEGVGDAANLREGEEGGDVEFHAEETELFDEREARLTLGVGDRNLRVDVGGPRGDFQGLALHVYDVVGEDLEGNGFGGDGLEDVFGEGFVVFDAGFFHQRGVGGQALDVRLGVEFEDAGFVGTVGVQLDFEGSE